MLREALGAASAGRALPPAVAELKAEVRDILGASGAAAASPRASSDAARVAPGEALLADAGAAFRWEPVA